MRQTVISLYILLCGVFYACLKGKGDFDRIGNCVMLALRQVIKRPIFLARIATMKNVTGRIPNGTIG